jgi:hypothetical protein
MQWFLYEDMVDVLSNMVIIYGNISVMHLSFTLYTFQKHHTKHEVEIEFYQFLQTGSK